MSQHLTGTGFLSTTDEVRQLVSELHLLLFLLAQVMIIYANNIGLKK